MDVDRLAKSPIGQLIEITGTDTRFQEDYRVKAFLPDPLPEAVTLASATHNGSRGQQLVSPAPIRR